MFCASDASICLERGFTTSFSDFGLRIFDLLRIYPLAAQIIAPGVTGRDVSLCLRLEQLSNGPYSLSAASPLKYFNVTEISREPIAGEWYPRNCCWSRLFRCSRLSRQGFQQRPSPSGCPSSRNMRTRFGASWVDSNPCSHQRSELIQV